MLNFGNGRFYFSLHRVTAMPPFDPDTLDSISPPASEQQVVPLHWSVKGTWVLLKPEHESRTIDWRPISWGSYGRGNAYETPRSDWFSVSGLAIALALLILAYIPGVLRKARRSRRGFAVVPGFGSDQKSTIQGVEGP